jgi:hemolysin activation/secretion protein
MNSQESGSRVFNRNSIAFLMALAAGAAQAQTPPNIGDALRQSQPPPMPAAAPPALPVVGGNETIEPPMTRLPDGPTIAVKALKVEGNRVIDTAALQGLVADGAGKTLSLRELEDLALRITRHYRAQGYFVARAYIPAQDVTGGTVLIRVVEGNYGRFHLANTSRVRDATVQAMLDDAKTNNIVSVDTLERAMLIINDTPGAQVTRADVMPGEKVGTSDFAVDVAPTAAYDGFIVADNYGSVYTGKDRLSLNANANSPFGLGDRLSLTALATDGRGLFNGGIAYSLPVLPNGLRAQLDANDTSYQLGNAYNALDAVGTAKSLDAGLSYPVRRTHDQTIEANGGVSFKDLLDEVRRTGTHTPKTSKALYLGASLRDERKVLGFSGLTRASVTAYHGVLDINDAAALALDAAGPRSAGSYSKVDVDASRSSLLPADFTLNLALRLQQTVGGKSLDGSERMAVSGTGGVLAYPPGELIGDNARFARIELDHPLAHLASVQTAWQVFCDYGQASDARPVAPDSDRHLSDMGLGFDAIGKGPTVHASIAHRLQQADPLSEPAPKTKFLVQLGWIF